MTMVACVVQRGAAYLYADTAVIDPATGNLVGSDTKIRAGSGFPWAVGVSFSGAPQATDALSGLDADTPDSLAAQLPIAIAAFKSKSATLGFPDATMRLVLATYDVECEQPRVFIAGDGLSEFQRSPWCSPGVTEVAYFFDSDFSDFWAGSTPNDPQAFDVMQDGVAVFQARRSEGFQPIGGTVAGHHVGGQIVLARIDRDGVQGSQLWDWHDPIGKPIDPAHNTT